MTNLSLVCPLESGAKRFSKATAMRLAIFGAVLALTFLFSFVKVAIQPQALQQDWQPSSADLSHPPGAFGATAVVAAPREPRH